jgi:hypothetical protein
MGAKLHSIMRGYINAHRKRQGGTGRTARAINFEPTTSPGLIHWGIGNLDILYAQAPWWHVLNYGARIDGRPFVPGGGKVRPVKFTDGDAKPNLRGRGIAGVTGFKRIESTNEPIPSVIRPMNYIEYTQAKMTQQVYKLLASLKRR